MSIPSTVVTDFPLASPADVWHANARLPSMCTKQAPQSPAPQPKRVPSKCRSSRQDFQQCALGIGADGFLLTVHGERNGKFHIRLAGM